MVSVKQCMLCGKSIGHHSCSMCGRVVCSSCYDASTGLCAACKHGKTS